jgi:hypothetical protein
MLTDAEMEPMRYVRIRCPYCQATSPTVDQVEDPARRAMGDWWYDHRLTHLLRPIIEIAPAPIGSPDGGVS